MPKLGRAFLSAAAIFVASISIAARASEPETGCSTKESTRLAFIEGTWRVDSRFRISSKPEKWETTNAVSTISPVFAGCLWKEELTGTRGGKPFTMIGLFGYSNVSNKFQHTWAHSRHGMLTFYEGDLTNGELVFETKLELRGMEVRLRKVISRVSDGFDARTLRSTDEGSSWQETWVLKYRRSS